MKKYLFVTFFAILLTSCNTTNEKETRNLERFEKVNIVGNVELHLERNSDHSIEVMASNTDDIADLVTEVRNGELYIYNEKDCDNCQSPKYHMYLNHSGLSDVNLTGKITLHSDDEISQKDLVIRGNGILNGALEVAVNTLHVDLRGITNLSISGNADTSNLKVTGIGLINAARLKTKSSEKASRGIAFVNK